MDKENKIKYSILIPVFNEEKIIKDVILNLSSFLNVSKIKNIYEIVVVNDGSGDDSGNILDGLNLEKVRVLHNPYNKGYGASLKNGAKNTKGKYLIFYDGDNQHRPKDVIKLTEEEDIYDMVIGARQGYKGPLIRQPGKRVLSWIASYLVDYKIPDLNSGLRLVKKDLFNKYEHLYPNNFSLTTTITLAFLKEGLNVKYIPIKINKRVGKSVVSLKDAFKTFLLITRIVTLFSPMRFFAPFSACFVVLLVISIINDVMSKNVSDSSVLLFVSTILIFFFGIVLDQIAAIRRGMK